MPKRRKRDIFHRWEGNPVLTLDHLSFPVSDICNAGAVKMGNKYVLCVSIQHLEGHYSIHLAQSDDGYHFEVNDQPLVAPFSGGADAMYSEHGTLDARITWFPEENVYYLTYDTVSSHGYRLALARTTDFQELEYLGLVSEPDTKAGVLFPCKVRGRYARLERPWEGGSIWVSYSDDLIHWGWSEVVMAPRGGFWDNNRVGAATPPMAIEHGWLIIYYGIKETSGGPLFRLGAAILDAENPAQVVGRTNVPVLAPREEYERIGDVPNLVFSCGAIMETDAEVKLYYGAADSCVCVGTTHLIDIVQACLETSREF